MRNRGDLLVVDRLAAEPAVQSSAGRHDEHAGESAAGHQADDQDDRSLTRIRLDPCIAGREPNAQAAAEGACQGLNQ